MSVGVAKLFCISTICGVISLSSGSLIADDGPSPEYLIKRMLAATSALNYEGVFVYHRGGHFDSMRILHRVNGETEFERLVSLSGAPREVIRKGDEVRCFLSDDKAVMVEKIEPKDFLTFGLSNSVDEIPKHYALKLTGNQRIAGREATTISIVPVTGELYAYQLALDREYGLLLKSATFGRDGEVLEQVQFASIEIGQEIPLAAFEPEISGEGFNWHTLTLRNSNNSPQEADGNWSVTWLPAGFVMRNQSTRQLSASPAPVSQMVYSDGLAMVSIFVEQVSQKHSLPQKSFSTLGAINAMSSMLGDHQITVVGEVPMPTLRKIAGSVEKIR